jgi:hypothetical protein
LLYCWFLWVYWLFGFGLFWLIAAGKILMPAGSGKLLFYKGLCDILRGDPEG